MTRAQTAGCRLRLAILIAGIAFVAAGLTWILLPYAEVTSFGSEYGVMGLLGTPLAPLTMLSELDEVAYAFDVVLLLGVLLLAQWGFLRPGRGWTTRVSVVGRPMRTSVIAAALMATLLSTGLVAMLIEPPDWWAGLIFDGPLGPYAIWVGMAIMWAVWAWIFFRYWRKGDRATQLDRMLRGLVAGSMVELLVAVPAHVWATRARDCYCARGTYTTLVLASVVLVWAFGPGIVMLYMHERCRRARLFPACACGYALRASIDAGSRKCPECGRPIPTDLLPDPPADPG